MIWLAVVGGSVACYAEKVLGFLVPERFLTQPALRRVTVLIPVALLAALMAIQTFTVAGGGLAIDARLVGLVVAAVSLALRAPFLIVILAAAAAAALTRLLGWLP
jgi:branched-subunit amino acid transport protein